MSFADIYLEKQQFLQVPYEEAPHPDLNMVVMIPCFNEPDIVTSLQSLWDAQRPNCAVETIVIVNESETTDQLILAQNEQSIREIEQFILAHRDDRFRFYCYHAKALPKKHAGVGLARKIGMDAALSRFNQLNRPKGLILSFDADATVAANYFTEIEKHYHTEPKTMACVVSYEHPVSGEAYDAEVYNGIIQYELYLRYYYQALKYAGHPHAYHTVGSSFNCKAAVYAKQGGMNRRQAGEDFYFLQKIIPHGKVHELNSTTVYPSPRGSDRVPFGTGATINQLLNDKQTIYLTYDFDAFLEVKRFIEDIPKFHVYDEAALELLLLTYTHALQTFLKHNKFVQGLKEIKNNSTDLNSFTKRFYNWFNAFRVLKYLNFAHEGYYACKPIAEMAIAFLVETEIDRHASDALGLLMQFRRMES